jgi:multidrug efflux pump subunit AcrA (membrane-fusion protein)
MQPRERIWVKYVLALLCAGAIAAAALVIGPPNAPGSQDRTVTAQRGVVQSTVSGSGSLQAQETDLNFRVSGRLRRVYVGAGQHVAAGQLLAELDPRDARLGLDEAKANLSSAETKLGQAKSSSASQTTGKPLGTGSGSNATATDVAGAQAAVDSAR